MQEHPLNRRWLVPFYLSATLGLGGCAQRSVHDEPSQALPAAQSSFGRSIQALAQAHEGRSGFRLLANSGEAFSARAELIRMARTSLDLQYYIVHDGLSTRTLVEELLKAADRGVRVRILLDDTTTDGQDQTIATLAAHPQIQIRLFNPQELGRETGVTRSVGRLMNLSRASTGACTTNYGWPTTASASSAGATWATSISTPSPTSTSPMSTCSARGRWPSSSGTVSTSTGTAG